MIKIVERDNIKIKQVIHNNRFDINNVVILCNSRFEKGFNMYYLIHFTMQETC